MAIERVQPSLRDRFEVALEKLLGKRRDLQPVYICQPWAFDEVLTEILHEPNEVSLPLVRLNQLLLNCGRNLISPHFYSYFFSGIKTIEDFEHSVDNFRVKAMWLFGNFEFALKRMGACPHAEFESLILRTEPVDEEQFSKREAFDEIEEIEPADLELLGYLASKNFAMVQNVIERLTAADTEHAARSLYSSLGTNNQQMIDKVLLDNNLQLPDISKKQDLLQLLGKMKAKGDTLNHRIEAARKIGIRNTERYISLPYLDVYVATSMREKDDFIAQRNFCKSLFQHPEVLGLKLRYFDPTLSYVEDRISKGIVEMLMLRRSKLTIYCAGEKETFGKDSELAATLAQGKSVIVYVPEGKGNDGRAEAFRDSHPLGLQIDIETGVAHGIMVVRTIDMCAKMLRQSLLKTRQFDIEHIDGTYRLVERDTKSTLRVVSDDPLLTHAFWTYFKHKPDELL